MARSTWSRPSSSTPNRARASRAWPQVDHAVGRHLGEVAHPAQQAVGDRGGAPARRAISAHPPASITTPRMPAARADDGLEVAGGVVVEAGDRAEAVAQRAGDRARAGGGPHQGEAGQVEADRAGRRPLARDDVELEVLHRRVEHLFDRAGQAVDLVDEEHVAVVELGEDGGQVARLLDGRAGGGLEDGAELVAMMPARVVLPRPGGPENSRWSGAWPRRRAASSRMPRCALSRGLAHEVVQAPGAQRRRRPPPRRGRRPDRAAPHARAAAPSDHRRSRWSPRRSMAEASPSSGSSAVADLDLVGARSPGRPAPRARRWWRCARRAHGQPPRPPGDDRPASGTSRRDLSSTSSRAAVFLPTPGTRHRAATSSSARIRTRARGRGPTGWRAPARARPRGPRAGPRR